MGDSADLGLILGSLWQYMVIKLTMDGEEMKGHFGTKYTWCFVLLYFKFKNIKYSTSVRRLLFSLKSHMINSKYLRFAIWVYNKFI